MPASTAVASGRLSRNCTQSAPPSSAKRANAAWSWRLCTTASVMTCRRGIMVGSDAATCGRRSLWRRSSYKWSIGPMPSAKAGCRSPPATYRLAAPTASTRQRPCAKWQAMAAAKAQPVPRPAPGAAALATNSAAKTCSPSAVASKSVPNAASKWPPLTSTAPQPSARIACAAALASASDRTSRPARRSASATLGVTSSANGTSSRRMTPTASSLSKAWPSLAASTGSST